MTEQAIEAAIAPIVASALEDLHQQASAEITRLEKTVPPRLDAAEQTVQDWAHDALNTLHGLVARIEQHRQGASTEPATAAVPAGAVPPTPQAVASPAPPPSVPATPAASSTPGSAPAAAK